MPVTIEKLKERLQILEASKQEAAAKANVIAGQCAEVRMMIQALEAEALDESIPKVPTVTVLPPLPSKKEEQLKQ